MNPRQLTQSDGSFATALCTRQAHANAAGVASSKLRIVRCGRDVSRIGVFVQGNQYGEAGKASLAPELRKRDVTSIAVARIRRGSSNVQTAAKKLEPSVRLVNLALRALFSLVALLLLADLHSSYVAAHGQWETNPVLSALAEHIGAHPALLCAKVADLAMLGGLYVLWRRSKAHAAITVVLSISAFEYAQIVMNNYQG